MAEELGPPRPDTLYLACLHLKEGEAEEIKRIRRETNSLVIGWFWDNHHSYNDNSVLARELDICVPAHHHGHGFLTHANPRTTQPLPLCCAQWSIPTLEKLLADQPLSDDRSPFITGRFTQSRDLAKDWNVGSRRSNLVRSYGNGLIHKHIQLQLECSEDYAYFSLSPEGRFADWCQHHFSLCLPLQADLSLRFFDAIAAGQLPFVDQELAGPVLDDLAPSLIAGRDYLLVDAASPEDLLAARQQALGSLGLENRQASCERLRHGHLLEHRLALLAGPCLEVLREREPAQQQTPEPNLDTIVRAFDDCLAALDIHDDREALRQLGLLLEQQSPAHATREETAERWMEVLTRLDRRVQGENGDAPDPDQKAQLCWQAVAVVDRIGALLPAGGRPSWLPYVDEHFTRCGALLWRDRAVGDGEAGRKARHHAIVLLLRLSRLHSPCPHWVLLAARELLKSDLADAQALPAQPRQRLAQISQWERQLADQADLLHHLAKDFQQTRQRTAGHLDVSVVIPFHGRISELQVALNALEAQRHQDIEVVVVADGCALDEDVLEKLRAKSIPASLIALPENQGAFRARMIGAMASSATFLWFFDHDDYVDPSFLERMLDRARSSEADVVECPFWVVPEKGTPYWHKRFWGEELRHGAAILNSYLSGESHNNLANKLIRRSLWEQAMARLQALEAPTKARLIYHEDTLCTVLLYLLAQNYASTISTDYHYRQRVVSSMNSSDPAVISACLQSFEYVLTIIKPLLIQHCEAKDVVTFLRREIDWALDDLMRRTCNTLGTYDWALLGSIQSIVD
ncbi:glycosyltransferase family 2 protein [Cyanobium sp. ATX 6A2]|uniref:glycosyltransferase family 2 protein n=1 Tax=Cyanobium sp. ATX 6A2 TaxID=2823700 RepID=UPI0020CB8C2F|nr:glycosyltransferase family 2 protein [Cyanobium sp. ATX 6A2]MCP9889418.1 glycosyltransferase family 2 protein [Cyanobium sp. ATX 6A2]